VPDFNFRQYHSPGWVANGYAGTNVDQGRVEPDPIAANAMLFYKGWMTQLMAIHSYVSGNDDKYSKGKGWQQATVGGGTVDWTLPKMALHLHDQWKAAGSCGPH
jgi:hypothetical protein